MTNILQNAVFSVLFALGLFSGGAASAANAGNVQSDYDDINCADNSDAEICKNLAQLRDAQSAAAVSFCIFA